MLIKRDIMKRIRSRRTDSESLDLFDAVARHAGYRVGHPADYDKFVSQMGEALRRASANPMVLHGRRAQSMFGFVAASLGQCQLIREEDAGEVYCADSLSIPDYRLVLKSGTQLFVEVKNCNSVGTEVPIKFRTDYLKRLEDYSRLFRQSPQDCCLLVALANLDACLQRQDPGER